MKILVGYDGSKVSRAAVDAAQKRISVSGGEIIAATSLMVPDTIEEKEAREKLAEVESRLKKTGITVHVELLMRGGYPGEDLVQYAEEISADEIFLGLQKRSKVGKMLFGSTIQYVIFNAECPVVVVK